jgi:hypothetical protein
VPNVGGKFSSLGLRKAIFLCPRPEHDFEMERTVISFAFSRRSFSSMENLKVTNGSSNKNYAESFAAFAFLRGAGKKKTFRFVLLLTHIYG